MSLEEFKRLKPGDAVRYLHRDGRRIAVVMRLLPVSREVEIRYIHGLIHFEKPVGPDDLERVE